MDLLQRNLGFRRLWASHAISLLGDWLSYVSVSLLALHRGESAVALSLVLVAHSLPAALAQPVAGVLADRFDRKTLLFTGNLVQAALTLGMAVAAIGGSVHGVALLLVARTAAASVTMTASQAALPRLVGRDDLYRANALMSLTWSVTFAAGVALGGFLALLGPIHAIFIDAGTFLFAAFLLRGLPRMRPGRQAKGKQSSLTSKGQRAQQLVRRALFATGTDLRDAIQSATRDRRLFGAVLAKTPLALAGGSAWILLNLVAADPGFIGTGGLGLGLLHAVRGAGTGIGPWWAARQIERRELRDDAVRIGGVGLALIAIAVFTLLVTYHVTLWPAVLAATFLWGCGLGINWVQSTAAIQRDANDALLGRLSALDRLLATGGLAVGALIGAAVVDFTGAPPIAGGAAVVLGLLFHLLAQRLALSVPLAGASLPRGSDDLEAHCPRV